jgi:hypothetical protein
MGVQRKFKRLIILRSPKHFNVGKLQTYKIHSRCVLCVQLNSTITFLPSLRKYLFYISTKDMVSCPTTYITHVKAEVDLKFTFPTSGFDLRHIF